LAAVKITQLGNSQRLAGDKAISDIPHRLNSSPFQLGAQPADAHVHDVASRIAGVAHRRPVQASANTVTAS
jgi:hypothetical protein